MPRPRAKALAVAILLAGGAASARAESGLSDLEMDVMESGETPARAMSRIALPPKPLMQREPSLEAEGRSDLPSGEETIFRTAADPRVDAAPELPPVPPQTEGSD